MWYTVYRVEKGKDSTTYIHRNSLNQMKKDILQVLACLASVTAPLFLGIGIAKYIASSRLDAAQEGPAFVKVGKPVEAFRHGEFGAPAARRWFL